MDENARLEYDRQLEADLRNREQYCGNCSTLSPGGGYCASCRVQLSAGESIGGSGGPAVELSINDIIAEGFRADSQVNDAYNRTEQDNWFERTRQYCPNCSGDSPGGGYCSGCLAILQLENRESLAQPEHTGDPAPPPDGGNFPQGDDGQDPEMEFVNPEYCVDMRDFIGAGAETALGYPRDSRVFWDVMLDQNIELFSERNVDFIQRGLAPEVDEQWLKFHPGQEMYEGDRLIHHHWDQGPIAFGIPEHFHTEFTELLHPLRYPD